MSFLHTIFSEQSRQAGCLRHSLAQCLCASKAVLNKMTSDNHLEWHRSDPASILVGTWKDQQVFGESWFMRHPVQCPVLHTAK